MLVCFPPKTTVDMVLFLLGIMLAVPLSYFLKLIKTPKHRLVYCIISGIALQDLVFGHRKALLSNSLVVVAASIANLWFVYFLLRNLKRNTLGWTITLYGLVATGISHAERFFSNYGGWDMSISEILMMQTVHISTLAWDYQDGADDTKKGSRTALKELPGLMEYFAAGLSPSQTLAGPCSHIIDFTDYIYARKEFTTSVKTVLPGLQKFTTALFWLGVYVFMTSKLPTSILYSPSYSELPFHLRVRQS